MYCKWCGMESKDDKRCEWCGRPLVVQSSDPPADDKTAADAPAVTAAVPPVTTAVSPAADTAQEATTAVPPMDEDPAAAAPYNPRLSRLKPVEIEAPEIAPFGVRIEKYLGVMTILLAGGMATAHYLPQIWLIPFFALLFASGLLLGLFRVIGYYDDEFFDVAVVMAMWMFIGPVYATLAYMLLCLVKGGLNHSILGLMASCIVIRLTIGAAAHGFSDTAIYMLTFRVALDYITWMVLLFPATLLIGGWICASFTRPLNE